MVFNHFRTMLYLIILSPGKQEKGGVYRIILNIYRLFLRFKKDSEGFRRIQKDLKGRNLIFISI